MISKKIAILGASGLLGSHVYRRCLQGHVPHEALTHEGLDITDVQSSLDFLDTHCPDVVVNCAAFCSFQGCEDDPVRSEAVNLVAPCRWADECARRGIMMVHFSSDYIFDGCLNRPYREEDAPNPLSVYARHKVGCERHFAKHPGHLVLRISWLFGRGGRTFLSMLPDLLMARESLTVASGKRGACLHAAYAADVIIELIERGVSGLVNLVHEGGTSWEEFARACLEELHSRGLNPACREIIEEPYQELLSSNSARRPAYSVLDVGKLASLLGCPVKPWREGLRDYLELCASNFAKRFVK